MATLKRFYSRNDPYWYVVYDCYAYVLFFDSWEKAYASYCFLSREGRFVVLFRFLKKSELAKKGVCPRV